MGCTWNYTSATVVTFCLKCESEVLLRWIFISSLGSQNQVCTKYTFASTKGIASPKGRKVTFSVHIVYTILLCYSSAQLFLSYLRNFTLGTKEVTPDVPKASHIIRKDQQSTVHKTKKIKTWEKTKPSLTRIQHPTVMPS